MGAKQNSSVALKERLESKKKLTGFFFLLAFYCCGNAFAGLDRIIAADLHTCVIKQSTVECFGGVYLRISGVGRVLNV